MVKRIFFTDSQKVIFLTAGFLVLFSNFMFFKKLYEFAFLESNTVVTLSAPFILFLLFVLLLNIVLLPTYKQSLKIMLYILISVAALSGYFMNTFSTVIDKVMIESMFQTDSAEAFDLFTLKLLFYIVIFAIVPIFLLAKYEIEHKIYKIEILSKSVVIISSLLLVSLSYMLLGKYYSTFFRNHGELRYYLNPSYPIYSFSKYAVKQFAKPQEIIPIAQDAKIAEDGVKKRLFVFVVGETARAHNFSLNGYEYDTNPLLREQGVISFSDFYSCGTATAISLPCMFSKFCKDEYNDDKKSYENLVDVISKVGIRVLWRDNNSGRSKGVADRIKDVKYFGGEKFDEVMLEDLQQSIDASYEDTFIVLHQEGSHGPTYYKRYPDAFKKFQPTCNTQDLQMCTQEEIVNTYDNTILYTDYLLDKTIKFLQNNEQKYETFMLYVSDHGESLGESGIYLHGLPYVIAPDFQKHIPAVFYLDESMQDKKKMLENLKSNRYSHDNIFHTFLGLFGISTMEYDKNLDIFYDKKIS